MSVVLTRFFFGWFCVQVKTVRAPRRRNTGRTWSPNRARPSCSGTASNPNREPDGPTRPTPARQRKTRFQILPDDSKRRRISLRAHPRTCTHTHTHTYTHTHTRTPNSRTGWLLDSSIFSYRISRRWNDRRRRRFVGWHFRTKRASISERGPRLVDDETTAPANEEPRRRQFLGDRHVIRPVPPVDTAINSKSQSETVSGALTRTSSVPAWHFA